MRNLGMDPRPIDRKRRWGCSGCFTRVLLILALGIVLAVAMHAAFYPWSTYLGGHWHIPGWAGIAHVPSPAGDYILYFWIEPSSGGRTYNLPSFRGTGFLCTPRGERYRLQARAGMPEKTGVDTNGKAFNVELYSRPWYWNFSGKWDRRPELNFRGKWQNPDLVMDDGGTLAAAFNPDGTLANHRNNYYHADARNKVQVVFHEASMFAGWSGCPAK